MKSVSLISWCRFLPNLWEKIKFLSFSHLTYFGQEKATISICCLVTICHGNSHQPKLFLFLFFISILSLHLIISLIKITIEHFNLLEISLLSYILQFHFYFFLMFFCAIVIFLRKFLHVTSKTKDCGLWQSSAKTMIKLFAKLASHNRRLRVNFLMYLVSSYKC